MVTLQHIASRLRIIIVTHNNRTCFCYFYQTYPVTLILLQQSVRHKYILVYFQSNLRKKNYIQNG